MGDSHRVVMIGATGAVGGHVVRTLMEMPQVSGLTLLGRRTLEDVHHDKVTQHVVDLMDPSSYEALVAGHDVAVCTLGVGDPSKVSKEMFVRIDKEVVVDFAKVCKAQGIRHFELLSSIGVGSDSRSFFLRTKGELEDILRALDFERLSLFHPSMILTPENRYGFSQAVTLAVWPTLSRLMVGPSQKLRGIPVETLGQSIAKNIAETSKEGVEVLEWKDFKELAKT